jgi:hypothetical protein
LNPQTTTWTTYFSNAQYTASGTGIIWQNNAGFISNVNQYNGFTIFAPTNVSGNLAVYGYNI